MKKTLFQIALLALAMCCNVSMSAQKPFTLKGTVDGEKTATKVNIYVADEYYKIGDTPTAVVEVKKNKFTYKTTLTDPRPASINVIYDENESSPFVNTFFIPGEKAEVSLSGEKSKLSGSSFYNQAQEFNDVWYGINEEGNKLVEKQNKILKETAEGSNERKEAMKEFYAEAQSFMEEYPKTVKAYLEQHGNEEGAIISALNSVGVLNVYAKASDEVKNGRFGKYLNTQVENVKLQQEKRKAAEEAAKAKQAETGEGAMFVDFSAEYDGKVQKLSDYVGKGKYVLVDFWASWCGPCRKEIPNLINVWEKYKGDKFEVLGVATWDKPEDTVKAIEELKIQYPQIMNAQTAGSDAYGIQGIPQIILFAPDGKIVARNLRGDAIEAKVKECLGN